MADFGCGNVKSGNVAAAGSKAQGEDPRLEVVTKLLQRADGIDVRNFAKQGLGKLSAEATFGVSGLPVKITLTLESGAEWKKSPSLRVKTSEGASILLDDLSPQAASDKLKGISHTALRSAAEKLFAQVDALPKPTAVQRAPAYLFDDGKAV